MKHTRKYREGDARGYSVLGDVVDGEPVCVRCVDDDGRSCNGIVIAIDDRCRSCGARSAFARGLGSDEVENGYWVYARDGAAVMAEAQHESLRPVLDMRVFAERVLTRDELVCLLQATITCLRAVPGDAVTSAGGHFPVSGIWNLGQHKRPLDLHVFDPQTGDGLQALGEALGDERAREALAEAKQHLHVYHERCLRTQAALEEAVRGQGHKTPA